MESKPHCEECSGRGVQVDNLEKKYNTLCDGQKEIWRKMDTMTPRWAFAILILAFIGSVAYQFKTLSSIDTGVAVLNEKVKKIEEKVK